MVCLKPQSEVDELLHSGSTIPACDVVQTPPSPQTSVPASVPLPCTPIIPENWNADPPLRSVQLHQSSSNVLVIGSGGSGASAACLHLLLSLLEPVLAGQVGPCISGWCLGGWMCLCELSLVWQSAVPGPWVSQGRGVVVLSCCHRKKLFPAGLCAASWCCALCSSVTQLSGLQHFSLP